VLVADRSPPMPYQRAPRLFDLFDVRNLGARQRAGLSWAIQLGFLALLALVGAASWESYPYTPVAARVLGAAGVILVVLVYRMVRRLDRLRAEAAREAAVTHERFHVTLGSIGDAVLVTDEAGRLTYCNAASHSLLADPAAASGRPLDELFAFESEATGEKRESPVARAIASRGVERAPQDTALRAADGRSIPVDATAAVILDREGAARGVVLVVRDASERRERERELARSNERFRSFALATSQIVWTTDARGYAQEDSPAWRRLTGQTYEQWKGRGWLDAVHAEDRERVACGWMTAVAEEKPYQVEYRLRRVDGGYDWTMVRAVPVFDPEGHVREWVAMNHDIQARKAAEELQRDAHRRKDEFIALLAHELRNPLAPLRNGLEVLKSGAADDAPRAVAMMDRQLNHIVRLIDDLLDVSRISQGKLELRPELVDLREVVRQTVDAARPAIRAKDQQLFVNLPAAPLWVAGDAVRLAQVFTNLLTNAIKYSGHDASIWVTAEREGTSQLVSVRDTGQGIPAALKPLIWDLFLQGDGSVERGEGGLGIGLTLVKRLTEMHGGTVAVESAGAGAGSEFIVRFPVAPAPRAEPTVAKPARPASTRQLRVLIVDDNEDSAESLSMLLRIRGNLVHTALRAEKGLAEIESFRPELVFCDIRMPGMSGFDFARAVRTGHPECGALLVALTGFGSDVDRAASLTAGFDHHLVKPIDPSGLAALLAEAAREHAQRGSRS
jgi:two-component system CheB/CheR fusion protein